MFVEKGHSTVTGFSVKYKKRMLFQGGQVWLKDKEASHCKLCEKEFSISRRKVSCLNSGGAVSFTVMMHVLTLSRFLWFYTTSNT